MMKKKLLLATTIGLVSAPLFAASVSSVVSGLKSTSPGVQAKNLSARQPATVGSLETKPPVVSSPKFRRSSLYAGFGIDLLNDRGFTGLMPKAFVGYGTFFGRCKDFYSALEIGGGAGTILLSSNNQHYRVSNFVNVSILPGYMIYDDVLLYGRLGAQSTHYSQLNSTKNGGVFGIGLELFSSLNSRHWDTRFEYNFANNKNLNQFIMDFVYRFGC